MRYPAPPRMTASGSRIDSNVLRPKFSIPPLECDRLAPATLGVAPEPGQPRAQQRLSPALFALLLLVL
jgi:hypothetical protein